MVLLGLLMTANLCSAPANQLHVVLPAAYRSNVRCIALSSALQTLMVEHKQNKYQRYTVKTHKNHMMRKAHQQHHH